jgi:hypothetical protein
MLGRCLLQSDLYRYSIMPQDSVIMFLVDVVDWVLWLTSHRIPAID